MRGEPLGSVAANQMIARMDEGRAMSSPPDTEDEEPEDCTRCDGHGSEPDGSPCEACEGEGIV